MLMSMDVTKSRVDTERLSVQVQMMVARPSVGGCRDGQKAWTSATWSLGY